MGLATPGSDLERETLPFHLDSATWPVIHRHQRKADHALQPIGPGPVVRMPGLGTVFLSLSGQID